MRALGASLSPLLLSALAAAQHDRIVWTDGTVTAGVRVESFSWRAIEYTSAGQTEQRPADAVASLEVQSVADVFASAYAAEQPEEAAARFAEIAAERVAADPFVAQWGWVEAARVHLGRGARDAARAVLDELVARVPDTGFYPHRFRMQLDDRLAEGGARAGEAQEIAREYAEVVAAQGWPAGFAREADYYAIMARAAAGSLAGDELAAELQGLLRETEGAYPAVASRVQLRLADGLRARGEWEAARAAYRELVDRDGLDDATRAQALLGLGDAYLEGGARAETEPCHDAMISFLRAYLETAAVPRAARAEALYRAAQACEKWNGPDAAGMARRLRGYLQRDFAESAWAQK